MNSGRSTLHAMTFIKRNVVFLSLLLVAACNMTLETGPSSRPSSLQPTQTSGNGQSIAISYPPMPQNLERGSVVKVVDGDTLDVKLNGETMRVRTIGINTPESVDPRRPVECFGKEASTHAKNILSGQTVYLESDPSQQERDQYDRLLRYVWLSDGRLFNLQMIAEGYAYEYTYNLPYKYQKVFKSAQKNASNNNVGLWSSQTCNGSK